MEAPKPVEPTNKGIQNGGDTGIVGGSGEGLKAHDIQQSKTLDYRWVLPGENLLSLCFLRKIYCHCASLGKSTVTVLPWENLLSLCQGMLNIANWIWLRIKVSLNGSFCDRQEHCTCTTFFHLDDSTLLICFFFFLPHENKLLFLIYWHW